VLSTLKNTATVHRYNDKPILDLRSVTCHMGLQCYLLSDTGKDVLF